MTATTKNTFVGNECKVEIFIDASAPGNAPGATYSAWTSAATDVHEVYVAQNVSVNSSSSVTRITGLNQRKPYGTKDGLIEYSWEIGTLYTTDTYPDDNESATSYNILELIDKDGEGTQFAMLITLHDASGDHTGVEALQAIALTGCTVEESNWSISQDGDATVSLSGAAEDKAILSVT